MQFWAAASRNGNPGSVTGSINACRNAKPRILREIVPEAIVRQEIQNEMFQVIWPSQVTDTRCLDQIQKSSYTRISSRCFTLSTPIVLDWLRKIYSVSSSRSGKPDMQGDFLGTVTSWSPVECWSYEDNERGRIWGEYSKHEPHDQWVSYK